MDAQVFSGSLSEILSKLGALGPKEMPEVTEEQWRIALLRSTQDLAQEIIKGSDLPLLVSVSSARVSTYIVCEAQHAEFTITVTGRRKVEPTPDEPTFSAPTEEPAPKPCPRCGQFHHPYNVVTRDNDLKPDPKVWGGYQTAPSFDHALAEDDANQTKAEIDADEKRRAEGNRVKPWQAYEPGQ